MKKIHNFENFIVEQKNMEYIHRNPISRGKNTPGYTILRFFYVIMSNTLSTHTHTHTHTPCAYYKFDGFLGIANELY